jgi:hypothetical protein
MVEIIVDTDYTSLSQQSPSTTTSQSHSPNTRTPRQSSTSHISQHDLLFKDTKNGPVIIGMTESPRETCSSKSKIYMLSRVVTGNGNGNGTRTSLNQMQRSVECATNDGSNNNNNHEDNKNANNIYRAMDVLDTLYHEKNEESWTNDQEAILHSWAETAALYRSLHIYAYEYYSFINNIITYPIILLSALLGMSGFATITNEKPTTTQLTIAYISAFSNFIVALLTSIMKVKKYSEKSENHLMASVNYVKFYREIKLELVLDRGSRAYSIDFCRNIKHKFNTLTTNSPIIPQHIQKKQSMLGGMVSPIKPIPTNNDAENLIF